MRALALDPEMLLMDEPFGVLDSITRKQLHGEFLDLQHDVAKTVVLVTHDLEEAFLLGSRVALLRDGELVQAGTPEAIRSAPATPWVADFVAGRPEEPA